MAQALEALSYSTPRELGATLGHSPPSEISQDRHRDRHTTINKRHSKIIQLALPLDLQQHTATTLSY